MASAADDVVLLLLREREELDGVAGHADGEVGVFGLFRMGLCVKQLFHAEHVHVQVVGSLLKVSVHHGHQLLGAFFVAMAQGVRANGLGVADAIQGVFVGEFCHRVQRCQQAVLFGTVARVCTGSERCVGGAAVGQCTGSLSVNHVAGDGKDRRSGLRIAVGVVLLDLCQEFLQQPHGNFVGAVIVVSVPGEVPFDLEVFDQAVFAADHLHLGVLDGAEAVHHVAKARNAGSEGTAHVGIDKSQFGGFVIVLVVHVVDQVQGVHIDAGEPVQHNVVLVHHILVVQVVASNGGQFRANLHAGHQAAFFVLAAVNGVEQGLGQVGAGAKELQFLAGLGGGHAAADAVVVAPDGTHHVVVLVLDRTCGHRDVGGVFLEVLGKPLGIKHGKVGLRRGAHVFQSVQEAEVVLGDHGTSVLAHACHFQGGPHRVAAEQLVVSLDTGELDHAELHDHVVHQFLGFAFRKHAVLEVAFYIDIQEGRDAAHAHGGAVLGLDGREVAKVQPLEGLAGVGGGLGDVEAVTLGHYLNLLQAADLFCHFFTQADHLVGHGAVAYMGQVVLLLLDDIVDTVQGHTAVVAHDTPAAISVRKAS